MQMHNTDDPGEMESAERDIRGGEHQCAAREAALCPSVFPGKRISTVTLDIACSILKNIGSPIDTELPMYTVPHAENAVPALQKGHIPEWAHNVIWDWRECAESDCPGGVEVRRVDVQGDTLSGKPVLGKKDFLAPFLKICIGEWDIAGLRIGNQLDGTVFGILRPVNGGNHCQCLPIPLAPEIPPTEETSHNGPPKNWLKSIIPISQGPLDTPRGGKQAKRGRLAGVHMI